MIGTRRLGTCEAIAVGPEASSVSMLRLSAVGVVSRYVLSCARRVLNTLNTHCRCQDVYEIVI